MKRFLIFLFVISYSEVSFSIEYFVNSLTGKDSNLGTSTNAPWKSLNPVQAKTFQPGDIVNFACGSSWTKAGWEYLLLIDDNGTADKPIIFRSYGQGDLPWFSNSGQWNKCIKITADYVAVENLMVKNTGHACINIATGADFNIVRNCEFTASGMGVLIQGSHNLLTKNYVHDMVMIVNDPKTVNPDNDFGAMGFLLDNGHYNEISFNKAVKCRAPSYDYGFDGGFVETWTSAGNNYIHHNWVEDTEGFMEAGGTGADQLVADNLIAYNVAYNTTGFTCLHTGGGNFNVTVKNLRIENNTIISTSAAYRVIGCIGASARDDVISLKNNVIYSPVKVCDFTRFNHTNNIYYLTNGATPGFALHATEKSANPLFVDFTAKDFRLKPGSPAIDTGSDLNYKTDFDEKPVPFCTAPDIGAFEFQGQSTGSFFFPKNRGSSFSIFPNPANSVIHLAFEAFQGQKIEIEIFNSTGSKLVYHTCLAQQNGSNKYTVDFNPDAGIYFARIVKENFTETKKFMVL